MIRNATYTLISLIALHGLLCATARSAPSCHIDPAERDERVGAAAGCFVVAGGRLLVVRHRYNGKLGVPGGLARTGEKAQCAAHRETWEESGIEVEVGSLVKRFGNGFLMYACKPRQPIDPGQPLPVPASGRSEISEVLWVDPFAVKADQWRFVWQYRDIRRLFGTMVNP